MISNLRETADAMLRIQGHLNQLEAEKGNTQMKSNTKTAAKVPANQQSKAQLEAEMKALNPDRLCLRSSTHHISLRLKSLCHLANELLDDEILYLFCLLARDAAFA